MTAVLVGPNAPGPRLTSNPPAVWIECRRPTPTWPLNSAIVHTDDIAWNHAYFDWGAALVENILQPLHRGEAVDFRPDAWITHDRPGSITIPAGADFIWVEGTGIIREELAPWLDASVWMQGDLAEQERFLVVRDGESPEQLEHVANWLLEELPFMLQEQPWARATMIVAGPPQIDHDPDTELVVARRPDLRSADPPAERARAELGGGALGASQRG